MKRHIRIIIILVISMFLFNINDVKAGIFENTWNAAKNGYKYIFRNEPGDTVCQYTHTIKNVTCENSMGRDEKVEEEETLVKLYREYTPKDPHNPYLYLQQITSYGDGAGGNNSGCPSQTYNTEKFLVGSSFQYADVSGFPEFSVDNFCSAYAVFCYGETATDYGIFCFDNDGKYCTKKYVDEKGRNCTKELKSGGQNVNGFGEKKLFGNEEEDEKKRNEVESSLIEQIGEQRIMLKKKKRQTGSDCKSMLGPVVTEDVNKVLKYIQYLGPILVTVLGILDFIKAVASGSSETFNGAWKKLLKRLIVALLLFFVVILVKFIFHVFGITAPDTCLN